MDRVGEEVGGESKPGADSVGIVECGGQQDDQEEGVESIDPGPLGGVPLECQMSSDFVESGVVGFCSTDGGDGGFNIVVGSIEQQVLAWCPLVILEFQFRSVRHVRDDDMAQEGDLARRVH
jgi:hypothetical protein